MMSVNLFCDEIFWTCVGWLAPEGLATTATVEGESVDPKVWWHLGVLGVSLARQWKKHTISCGVLAQHYSSTILSSLKVRRRLQCRNWEHTFPEGVFWAWTIEVSNYNRSLSSENGVRFEIRAYFSVIFNADLNHGSIRIRWYCYTRCLSALILEHHVAIVGCTDIIGDSAYKKYSQ